MSFNGSQGFLKERKSVLLKTSILIDFYSLYIILFLILSLLIIYFETKKTSGEKDSCEATTPYFPLTSQPGKRVTYKNPRSVLSSPVYHLSLVVG